VSTIYLPPYALKEIRVQQLAANSRPIGGPVTVVRVTPRVPLFPQNLSPATSPSGPSTDAESTDAESVDVGSVSGDSIDTDSVDTDSADADSVDSVDLGSVDLGSVDMESGVESDNDA